MSPPPSQLTHWQMGALRWLATLDLEANAFTGGLPSEWGALSLLAFWHMVSFYLSQLQVV